MAACTGRAHSQDLESPGCETGVRDKLFSPVDNAAFMFFPWIASPGKSMLAFVQKTLYSLLNQK